MALYCSQSPGCICDKCLYRWSLRCESKCDVQGCKGGFFYQAHECERFVEYDQSKSVIKDCIEAVVQIFQDGYVWCSLVETVGCEECIKRFEEKMKQREADTTNIGMKNINRKEINVIKNIEISKLHPHYDNPRKDLGDLTELAESIKVNGIFQNLTVVPWFSKITGVGCDDPKQQEEMGYIAVIGHRRLAAAKLAGLTEVPCVISNMNMHDQISTMLLENMQRSDLTVYEQANGFQMMLDLGDSVDDISKRTGFSETTVRRRVKLLELDGEKFRKSVERGATLMDYAELDKIQDKDLRNKVLDKIGTPNFKWELQNAISKEASDKNKALIIAELEKFAARTNNSSGLLYVKCYYVSQKPDITAPDDTDTVEYFFHVSDYGSVNLYKKYEQSKTSVVQDEKQNELRERHTALDEISKRAYQLRCEFIKDFSNAAAKKSFSVIAEYSVRAMLEEPYVEYDEFAKALNIDVNEDDEYKFDDIAESVNAQPERHLLVATHLSLDSGREHYYNWNNQYDNNEILNTVYAFLEKLGYEMSDEERALRDGTHKLFASNDT